MAAPIAHEGALPLDDRIDRAGRRDARARRGTGRRALVGVGFAMLAIVALAGSAILHLTTRLGLEAARDGLVAWLSSRIRGTAYVGELTHLDFHEMAMTDFRITAPDGETVIRTERMGGIFDWGELFSTGTMQLAPCYFDKSEIWLTPRGPEGQVNLVHAMEVPDGRFTVPLEMNDIRLIDNILHIDLPGKPAVTMRDVNGFADLHVGHLFEWRMDRSRGYTDLEPFHVGFRHMSGRLRSDHAHPLVVRMLLDLEVAEKGVGFDYHVPALEDAAGDPHFGIDLNAHVDVTDDQDDCAEGDREHCPGAARDERVLEIHRARLEHAREGHREERAREERQHD